MNPDEIKAFIGKHFKEICFTPRHRPDGWSFWYRKICRGSNPTRIARAVETRHGGPAEFKLAVSSRLEKRNIVQPITSEEELRDLFADELKKWKEHFGK